MVIVNGKELQAANKTIANLVAEEWYNLSRIAIELNGEIIPKCNYDKTILKNGDKLEVVTFVGGGW